MVAVCAGFVDTVLNGDAVWDPAARGEEIAVDSSHHMEAHVLSCLDSPIDGGLAVDGAGGLDHDGIDETVRLQLEGKALYPPGGGVL